VFECDDMKVVFISYFSAGIHGLYKGVVPNLVGNGAAWGIYFFLYSSLKSRYVVSEKDMSNTQALVLATISGGICQVLTNPVWLVKVRLQSQPHQAKEQYSGMIDAFRTILKEEGFKGFYRGITPALFGTSHGAVQMAAYEKLKQWTIDRVESNGDEMGPGHYLVLGMAAKAIASVATFPYQLVKTRMQVRDIHFHRQDSVTRTLKSVWKNEGMQGFYRGVVPATVRTIPHSALMFASYEMFRSALSQTKL